VLDMMMPGMDGVMLAQAIRAHKNGGGVPLIMLSSLGNVGGQRDLFAMQLTKPVKPSQLREALVELFEDRPAAPPAPRRAAEVAQINKEMARDFPLRILLAEDNVVNQKVAMRMLGRLGYRIDVAANGLEVLDALRRLTYDVILMDVQMPEMDGVAATRTIRQKYAPEKQPLIIAMTANALKGDRDRYLEAGMDDYVSKPIRLENLMGALMDAYALLHQRTRGAHMVGNGNYDSVSRATNGDTDQAQTQPVDLGVLRDMIGGDQELLIELIALFIEDCDSQVARLPQVAADADPEKIRRVAHYLKGVSANVGAVTLARTCAQLEELAENGGADEHQILDLAAQIRAEYGRVRLALEPHYAPA
jgi:CheY-like chemotaxis protein